MTRAQPVIKPKRLKSLNRRLVDIYSPSGKEEEAQNHSFQKWNQLSAFHNYKKDACDQGEQCRDRSHTESMLQREVALGDQPASAAEKSSLEVQDDPTLVIEVI